MATKMPKSKQRVLQTLADFATVILITAIFVIIYLNVTPFYRGFYCTDETIRFPYKADTVPLWAAGLYGVLVAISAVVMAELYLARPCCVEERKFSHRQNRFILNTIHGILLYALGAMSTMLITEIGKHTIGRLRPHFLTVCDPDFEKLKCFNEINGVQVPIYVPLTEAVCRGADKRVIKEARLSFPSGHSSFTTYSMVFVIIYLEARLILQRTRFIKSIIQLIAFILAWHTCMSRVSDFKHHYTDVIAGAVIGMSFAIFVTVVTGKKLWYVAIHRCKNKVPNSLDVSSADENEEYEDDDNLNQIRGNTFEL